MRGPSRVSMALMAIIPAHIMRSVAGGYDNESIAVTAICLTFWLWVRALRTPQSWPIGTPPTGFLAGLAYIYMVAAWGGYIFVVNMVGAHAALMVILGRYSTSLYRAYSLFFIVLEGCDVVRRRRKYPMSPSEFFMFRAGVFGAAALAVAVVWGLMFQLGWHTKTGNPLVDSVAEHQATSPQAFEQYLHHALPLAKIGFLLCLVHRTPGAWFLVLYAYVAQHFSVKMSRLILICGPRSAPPPERTGGMGSVFRAATRVATGWT
eukprot:gene9217-53638_t